MNYSKSGLALTESFENFAPVAYRNDFDPPNVWTKGFGQTEGVKEGDTCTLEEATAWLEQRYQLIADSLNTNVKPEILAVITQGEFDALCDLAYNIGISAEEHSTLWRLLQEGDFAAAALQFPRWDRAGGMEVKGLLRRRIADQAEFNQANGQGAHS